MHKSIVPPHSVEAEKAVLGAILDRPAVMDEVCDLLAPEYFYLAEHRSTYLAILQLYEAGIQIDMVTVGEKLKDDEAVNKAGFAVYLAELIDGAFFTANLKNYVKLIRGKYRIRRVIEAVKAIEAVAYEPGDADDICEFAESTMFKATYAIEKNRSREEHIKDIFPRSKEKIEEISRTKTPPGISSGFGDLDRCIIGFQDKELTIIAARPSVGKTSFVQNLILSASKSRKTVLFFSLEMGKSQIVNRFIGNQANINVNKISRGTLSRDDWVNLTKAGLEFENYPIFINDGADHTVSQIRSAARRMIRKSGLDMIVVDYLQLLLPAKSSNSRDREVSDMSRGLKVIAKDLEVPVIALSQLNRKLEDRTNKRPIMADLRDSGSIEQDADLIMFLYRDELYFPNTRDKNIAEVLVGKNRNGPTGVVRLWFDPEVQRFTSISNRPEPEPRAA